MRRRFCIELVLLIAILIIADRLLYAVLAAGFRRVEVGETGGMVNRARHVKADIVVVGSSRAWRHYDTEVLSKALGVNAYNAGCDGQGPPYWRGVVDLILKSHPPRLLIVDAEPAYMLRSARQYDAVTVLAPYISESEVIRRMIYRRSCWEPLKYVSQSFCFNGKPLAILRNMDVEDTTISGFNPLDKVADRSFLDEQTARRIQNLAKAENELDPSLVELLRDTVQAAKGAGTRVVLVLSPKWDPDGKLGKAEAAMTARVRELAGNEEVEYLHITQQEVPALGDPNLFADRTHLNRDGARVFTSALVERLLERGGALAGWDGQERK